MVGLFEPIIGRLLEADSVLLCSFLRCMELGRNFRKLIASQQYVCIGISSANIPRVVVSELTAEPRRSLDVCDGESQNFESDVTCLETHDWRGCSSTLLSIYR